MKVAALVSILPASFALSWPFRQQPFGETPSDQLRTYEDSRIYNLSDTSSFLFNSLVGLLQQFPNSVHPNGHTICPGVIRAYTPLYHATSVAIGNYSSPPSPEWLAFDAEMSYGISESLLALCTVGENNHGLLTSGAYGGIRGRDTVVLRLIQGSARLVLRR